jgi:hypothetical protein
MKILHVEDNDDNVYMLKNRLSRAGFTVIVATDGRQGITMAASEQPDNFGRPRTPFVNWACRFMSFEARTSEESERAFARLSAEGVKGVVLLTNPNVHRAWTEDRGACAGGAATNRLSATGL